MGHAQQLSNVRQMVPQLRHALLARTTVSVSLSTVCFSCCFHFSETISTPRTTAKPKKAKTAPIATAVKHALIMKLPTDFFPAKAFIDAFLAILFISFLSNTNFSLVVGFQRTNQTAVAVWLVLCVGVLV